jgi:hypothetical protein
MDWPLVIDRNRTALLTIIVALMVSLGLVSGGRLSTLPFFLYRRALRILRPAESAVRRLIMIVAHEMALRGFKLRAARRDGLAEFLMFSRPNPQAGERLPAFDLIDPLKIFGREAPDMDGFYSGENSDAPDKTPVPAASLGLRILALKHALENLPRHAKRLARWYEQRDLAYAQNLPHRYSPMRPGPAPASRRRKDHEVDAVLLECHLLAIYAGERHDSS